MEGQLLALTTNLLPSGRDLDGLFRPIFRVCVCGQARLGAITFAAVAVVWAGSGKGKGMAGQSRVRARAGVVGAKGQEEPAFNLERVVAESLGVCCTDACCRSVNTVLFVFFVLILWFLITRAVSDGRRSKQAYAGC